MAQRVKPKVLHVIDHTQSGGAQEVVGQIIRSLGDDFTFLVAVLGRSGLYSSQYRAAGATVFELGSRLGRWDLWSFKRLVGLCQQHDVDLVHTALFKSHIIGGAAAHWGNRKLITHDHRGIYPSSVEYFLPSTVFCSVYLQAYRQILNWSDQTLVLTEACLRGYQRAFPRSVAKVRLARNAVDVDKFAGRSHLPAKGELQSMLGLAPSTRIILTVGRLASEKDHATFLQVAQQVSQRSQDPLAFLIAGEGPCESQLKSYVSSHAIKGVHFLGHRQDVPWLLRQADVFLFTSQREELPIALLEAMAAGCPIVATRSGGSDPVLTHGQDGLLAGVGDVQSLSDCVIRLLEDDVLRCRLAQRAYETVSSNYSLERFAAQIAATYWSVLEES